MNRGNGIEVFNNQNQLQNLIQRMDQMHSINTKRDMYGHPIKLSSASHKTRKKNFILQKYCEDLMLIGDRKFDVRMLVLVTANMEIFILKEGYLRLSGKSYSLDDNDLSNKYIHLTNNAIQKNCSEYCMFESGNQMNFDEFQEYLDSKNLKCSVKDNLFKKMKNIVSIVISSVSYYREAKICRPNGKSTAIGGNGALRLSGSTF